MAMGVGAFAGSMGGIHKRFLYPRGHAIPNHPGKFGSDDPALNFRTPPSAALLFLWNKLNPYRNTLPLRGRPRIAEDTAQDRQPGIVFPTEVQLHDLLPGQHQCRAQFSMGTFKISRHGTRGTDTVY
jgi:hypothetical protein